MSQSHAGYVSRESSLYKKNKQTNKSTVQVPLQIFLFIQDYLRVCSFCNNQRADHAVCVYISENPISW